MPKNIMREFRIDRISGVDLPAQQGAIVAIMKRTTPEDVHNEIVERAVRLSKLLNVDVKDIYRIDHFEKAVQMAVKKAGVNMPEETTQTNEPTLQQVQAKLDRAESIVALSSEERAHFDALPEDMRDTFLGKNVTDRRAEIVAKNDADPVVYTTTDGVEIRKSAGEAMIAIAKSNDELRKANDSLVKAREQDALEKRADVELSHLPGDLQSRAALLKAVESIPDDKQRETALAALKSQNETAKGAYRTLGHGGGLGEPSSDEDRLDKMAKSTL